MKKTLNVKTMMYDYARACEGMDRLWKTFYQMHGYGYITYDEWTKFYKKCHGWYWDDSLRACVDDNGKIVWQSDWRLEDLGGKIL